jgi:CheY-like chemotaxis protein/HPt (histidine-containing phosphotransfer) domain-containing protein
MAMRKANILVVDDKRANLIALDGVLGAEHNLVFAESGQEAIAALQRRRDIDLILMDVQMPEMGGFEATAAIRAIEAGGDSRIPIIAMTAHAMSGDRERCLDAGMDDYITKPIEAETLCKTLEHWTGQILVSRRTARPAQDARVAPLIPPPTPPAPASLDAGHPNGSPADLSRLRELSDGDSAVLERLINLFLDDAEQHRKLLEDAVQTGDANTIESEAHRIKGGASQVGAETLRSLAAELEGMGRTSDLNHADDVLAAFRVEYERVSGYLRGEIQS